MQQFVVVVAAVAVLESFVVSTNFDELWFWEPRHVRQVTTAKGFQKWRVSPELPWFDLW